MSPFSARPLHACLSRAETGTCPTSSGPLRRPPANDAPGGSVDMRHDVVNRGVGDAGRLSCRPSFDEHVADELVVTGERADFRSDRDVERDVDDAGGRFGETEAVDAGEATVPGNIDRPPRRAPGERRGWQDRAPPRGS